MADEEITLPVIIDAIRAMQRQVDIIHQMATATQFSLLAALDEATRGTPDRQDLLERIVQRLENPTPNYEAAAGQKVLPELTRHEMVLKELAAEMRRQFGLGQPAHGSGKTLS